MARNLDRENEEIQKRIESREAGVTELLELYARVEPIYVAATQALEERRSISTSDATNPR